MIEGRKRAGYVRRRRERERRGKKESETKARARREKKQEYSKLSVIFSKLVCYMNHKMFHYLVSLCVSWLSSTHIATEKKLLAITSSKSNEKL